MVAADGAMSLTLSMGGRCAATVPAVKFLAVRVVAAFTTPLWQLEWPGGGHCPIRPEPASRAPVAISGKFRGMLEALNGVGFTLAALGLIAVVFLIAELSLFRELGYVKSLTDQLGYALAGDDRPPASLQGSSIHDEMRAATSSGDRATASQVIRGWEMRVHRLEPALAFWVDLLRQLGLLFTVLGLGLAFAAKSDASGLLEPLSLAVWTTVAGLALSIFLSAQFGTRIPVWADACEKNIAAWCLATGIEVPG